jgi:translation initiation factor eIF-2B subunit delta
MMQILDSINDIVSNRTSGASELAVQTLHVLKQAVTSGKATDTDSFARYLLEVIDNLAGCRPTIATIYNAAQRFSDRLLICTLRGGTLDELRLCCIETLAQLEKEIVSNKTQSILNAANFIKNGSLLATCSYSSTFIETIHHTVQLGKKLSLRILQSQSGGISYGHQTQLRLEADGIDCKMVPDDLSLGFLDGVDLVLLGADVVFRNGSVLNGYPSLKLATTAAVHTPPIPVYAICDSLKFCLDRRLNIIEAGFEVIPSNLLTGLITEDGILISETIIQYLDNHTRHEKIL